MSMISGSSVTLKTLALADTLTPLSVSLSLYFYRPSMMSGSSVILMTLALADTLNLLSVSLSLYLQENVTINLEEKSIGCKINRYLKFVFGYYANWLIIVFTIFRLIAVYLPHKVKVYCSKKRASVAVVTTFVMCCFVHLDVLVPIDIVAVKDKNGRFGQNRCWFEGSRYFYYTYHFRWVLLAFMSLLPFTCLMVGNCLIIYKMVKYNVERKRMSLSNNSNNTVAKDS